MASQTVPITVINIGQTTENVTITSNQTWLTVDVSSATLITGTGVPQIINATISSGALASGVYTGIISITGSAGPVASIPVNFTLTGGGSSGGTSVSPNLVAFGQVAQS